MNFREKKKKLETLLNQYQRVAIAFSGGVDSMFLAAVAAEIKRKQVVLLTLATEFQARKDNSHAEEMARLLSLPHEFISLKLLDHDRLVQNGRDRCYHCKMMGFSLLRERALHLGFPVLAHGVNLDDLGDYRPGLKAAGELGVVAPLLEVGLTKMEIRQASKVMGLKTWNMPSQSCLAARVPYGELLTREKLKQIERAEGMLYDLGFPGVRVRHHGMTARIECDPAHIDTLAALPLRQKIVGALRDFGFHYVSLDLEGYVSGSMNKSIQ